VDLERRRPIELLPDREASTLTSWLKDHQAWELYTRSVKSLRKRHSPRGTDSHPGGRSVHLLQNLAAQQTFGPHSQALKIGWAAREPVISNQSKTVVVPVVPPADAQRTALPNSVGRARSTLPASLRIAARLVGSSAIARQDGDWSLCWYFRCHAPPPSRNAKDAVIVVGAAYLTRPRNYVLQRNDGCHDALRLFGRSKRVVILVAMIQLSLCPSLSSSPGTHEKRRRSLKQLPKSPKTFSYTASLRIWYYNRKIGNQMTLVQSHGTILTSRSD